jgi:hypothetical protein
VTPAAKPPQTPLGALLGEYRMWLIQERGLAVATVLRYESTARRFLQQQAMAGGVLKPAGLAGTDVNAFLLRECGRVSAGSAKARVAELRAVLRSFRPRSRSRPRWPGPSKHRSQRRPGNDRRITADDSRPRLRPLPVRHRRWH